VAGLNKQISDSDKAHDAEITAVKAEAQKSKRKCEDGVILVLLAVCFCTFRKNIEPVDHMGERLISTQEVREHERFERLTS
jgi:hypothetical protein